MIKRYWVPRYRYQLIDWFAKNRPTWAVKSWSKSRLFAVYFKIRDMKE